MLTVLNVAYPLAVASADSTGGAEQVLSRLDHALVAAGHRSIVLAEAGSEVADTLVPVRAQHVPRDHHGITRAWRLHAEALSSTLASTQVDVVHLHGHDFEHYLPQAGPPVLVTLHCPPHWYGSQALWQTRPRTWFNAVSLRQHEALPPSPSLLAPIENGVSLPESPGDKRSSYVLMLSSIAPEKGVHVALEAAHAAGLPLIVAGQLSEYPDHRRYFATKVAPLLDAVRLFIGPVRGDRKRRLLARARCVVVPSLQPEASCLVAREALAAGAPVVAFPSGALTDIVEHGTNGFLVRDTAAMSTAMVESIRLDHKLCRSRAEERFSLKAMTDSYLRLYAELAAEPSTTL